MTDKTQSDSQEVSAEQQARDLLERIGIEDIRGVTAGDLGELANLIADIASQNEQIEKLQEDIKSYAAEIRAKDRELVISEENSKFGWKAAREAHKIYEAEHTLLLTANGKIVALEQRILSQLVLEVNNREVTEQLTEQLTQANETIAALQARIEAADKPLIYADIGHLREVSNGNDMNIYASSEQDEQHRLEPLFTCPPITSERELELLAQIVELEDIIKSLEWQTGKGTL